MLIAPLNCWRTETQVPATTSPAAPVDWLLIRVLLVHVILFVLPWEFVAVRLLPETAAMTPLTPGFPPRAPPGPPARSVAFPVGVPAAFAAPLVPEPHPATTTARRAAPTTLATRSARRMCWIRTMTYSLLKASMGANRAARLAG